MIDTAPLLGPGEPAAAEIVAAADRYPCLLVADHASRRLPHRLGNLGVDQAVLGTHLACDIGTAAVTRNLSRLLGLPAVLCNYSRLAVDCNRSLEDPTAFLRFGDGTVIPGNQALGPAERTRRAEAIYWPYHAAIESELARIDANGTRAALFSVHSFTPVLDGKQRHWDAGVLWDKSGRLARALLAGLAAGGLAVGDNEPYSGRAAEDFTVDYHGERELRAHVAIEIRQDHLGTDAAAETWAQRLAAILEPELADPTLYGEMAVGAATSA